MAGSISIPTVGSDRGTEESDVTDALTTLNGLLTSSNKLDGAQVGATTVAAAALASDAVTTAKIASDAVTTAKILDANVTDAKLASSNNSVYRTLLTSVCGLTSDAGAATYILAPQGASSNAGAGTPSSGQNIFVSPGVTWNAMPPLIYFDDADYTVNSKTQKLRVRSQVAANATAPAINFTVGLYPVTVAGTADTLTFTLGTVVSGSTIAINAPTASTVNQGDSGDFTIPADGAYALGVVTSGTLANGSATLVYGYLQTRNV